MTGDRSTNANVTVAALVATVLVVVTTILLITFGAWAYRSERADRNAQLMRSINVEADQIAVSLALPVWNIDRPQIARVIQGLDSIPEIEAIVVNGGGTTYALTRNDGARLVPMNGRVPMEGLIVRDREIRFGGERIGTVRLAGTTKYVEAELRESLLKTVTSIIAIDLLLILTVWFVLWRYVLRPLVEIEKYAAAVSSDSAASATMPARIELTAELESVRSSIETMVTMLDERYAELQREAARRTESEERFRAIFDSVSDAIMVHDIDTGDVVSVNAATCLMFGYGPAEVMKIGIGTLSAGEHPYTAEEAMRRMKLADGGKPQLFQWRSRHKDGHLFWTEVNLRVATIGGSRRSIVVVRDITERRLMQDQLLDEKTFTDTAINTMTGLFFVQDRNGNVIRWNQTYDDLLPRSQADRDGKMPYSLIHPDDRARIKATVQEIFETGHGHAMARLMTPEERNFLFNGRTMELGGQSFMVATGVDITERLRLERELERSVAEWKQTFDTVHTPILVTDVDGKIVRVNRAALELSGLREQELIGRPIAEIGTGEPWQLAAQLVIYIAAEGSGTTSETKDAAGRTWDLTIEHFATPGDDAQLFILVLWEITGIVELQESLRRSETMSAMGALVAAVAHEVRNPLFGISATLDAYDQELQAPDYVEFGKTLRREVNRLIHLMRELLEYGKPAALTIARVQIDDVIEEAVQSRLGSARDAHVDIRIAGGDDVPPLLIDRFRLRQVFENLIDNAVQHSKPRQEVVISHAIIEHAGRPWVEYRVEDSGAGIAPADLDRIFEPFFSRREDGTGLGLSIVQRIVQEHAGRIFAANRPSGGAIVSVQLPLAEATAARSA